MVKKVSVMKNGKLILSKRTYANPYCLFAEFLIEYLRYELRPKHSDT